MDAKDGRAYENNGGKMGDVEFYFLISWKILVMDGVRNKQML